MKGSMLDTKPRTPAIMVISWLERVLESVCTMEIGQASLQCAKRVS